MSLKRTPLKRSSKPLRRTALKRGTKPLKRGNSLKKSPLRRITPKTASRRRKQCVETTRQASTNDGTCPKCGKPINYMNPLGRHHEIPKGVGGSDDPENETLEGWCCHQKERGWMTKLAAKRK